MRFVIIAFILCGCCTCPPPPVADMNVEWIHPSALATTAITTDSVEWASIADSTWYGNASVVTIGLGHIDSVSVAEIRLPTIEEEVRVELAKMEPTEPLGPWPCRWVYGTRREPAACPETPKEVYTITNGVMEINNTTAVVGCLVLHWKDVKDSVWHCGPDNGVFTR